MRENTYAATRVSEEGVGGGVAEQRFPAAPGEDGSLSLMQSVVVNGGMDAHLPPEKDPTPEQVAVPDKGCDPDGSPHGSSLLLGGLNPSEGGVPSS